MLPTIWPLLKNFFCAMLVKKIDFEKPHFSASFEVFDCQKSVKKEGLYVAHDLDATQNFLCAMLVKAIDLETNHFSTFSEVFDSQKSAKMGGLYVPQSLATTQNFFVCYACEGNLP